MEEIQVESTESDVSSCSRVSYEGTDGQISDGEDPFFIPPQDNQDNQDQFSEEQKSSQAQQNQDQQNKSNQKGIYVDHAKVRAQRQKKKQVKEIMDQLKYGRNTTLLLNMHPLVPTYEQLTKTISEIRKAFPKRSLFKIVTMLYSLLILKPKEAQKQQILKRNGPTPSPIPTKPDERMLWLSQRRIAAEAFCQLGFGITKMRKFVESHNISIDITIDVYNEIINKLLLDAYKRLQRFLRKKCHKKIGRVAQPIQIKFLLDLLKNARTKLDSYQCHNYFKLIKLTIIKSQELRLSKRIASRLYHTCQEFIMRKKIKAGLMDPQNPQSQIYNDDKARWSQEMIQTAISLYIKEPSLNRVREIMGRMFKVQQYLLDNRNIKHHLQNKLKAAIQKIQLYAQQQQGSQSKLKKLIDLNDIKMKWIVNTIQATNVRVFLCEVYKASEPTLAQLNQAILATNQFILKKQGEEMEMEMRRTERQFNPVENQFRRRRRSKRR